MLPKYVKPGLRRAAGEAALGTQARPTLLGLPQVFEQDPLSKAGTGMEACKEHKSISK